MGTNGYRHHLPEVLQLNGFKTSAFSAISHVSIVKEFGRGFDIFLDLYKDPSLLTRHRAISPSEWKLFNETANQIVLPTAQDINDPFFRWLGEVRDETNFFALIWSIDPHAPYDLLMDSIALRFALMEAVSYGRPVISTYHAGIPELVEEILIEETNAEQLRTKIEVLGRDPEVRRRLGRRNQEIIQERFSERNIDCIVDVLVGAQNDNLDSLSVFIIEPAES